jgi:hypothetical protein
MMAIPPDKVLHFAAGGIAAAAGVLVLPWLPWAPVAELTAVWHAAVAAAVAALAREVYNHANGGAVDWRDIAATLVGGMPVLVTATQLA